VNGLRQLLVVAAAQHEDRNVISQLPTVALDRRLGE
jgi:hypothetical protein